MTVHIGIVCALGAWCQHIVVTGETTDCYELQCPMRTTLVAERRAYDQSASLWFAARSIA